MPVAVDFSARLETEQQVIAVVLQVSILVTLALVRVLDLAVPLNHISVALEVADADAEVVEFIGELSSEFVNESLISSGDIALSHSLGDHLSHLITRDVLVATERRVAIAFDDAISSELGYSVISNGQPVHRRTG